MGHSQAEKAATHSRVLRLASRKVRTEGVTRPGVAELMKEAGLTHGGFYKHFASRDDLIAQAAALALAEGTIKMQRSARKNEQDPRAGLIDAYLAKQHRDTPDTGCALVSLGASAGRGGQDFKEAYEKQVRTYLELIAGLDDDSEDARAEAMLTLSALVGAVLMSRAVTDQNFSDELLQTVAEPDRPACERRTARPRPLDASLLVRTKTCRRRPGQRRAPKEQRRDRRRLAATAWTRQCDTPCSAPSERCAGTPSSTWGPRREWPCSRCCCCVRPVPYR
jgi:TetR/AcrR family transcriptional repressor of nem operon